MSFLHRWDAAEKTNFIISRKVGDLRMGHSTREWAEEALRESEQRLADIIDFLPDATFAIDREGKVILWNRAIEEMTGVRTEDMLGKENYEYALPFYGIRRPILIDLVFRSDEEIEKEYHFVRKEGDIILAEADTTVMGKNLALWGKARPLYDTRGGVVGAIESIRDITKRRRAEETLQEIQRQQEALLNNIPDIAWLKDKKSRFIAVNEPFAKSCGYKAEDIIGKTDLDIWHRHLAEQYRADDKEVIESGRRKQVEEPLINSAGRASWIETIKTPIYNDKGIVTGTVGIARDITERRQAEGDIKESRQQLADIINFLPDATFVIDKEGRVIAWNRAIEEMTGIKKADMLGKGNYEYALPYYSERKPLLIDLVLNPDDVIEKKYASIERRDSVLIGESYTFAVGEGKAYHLGMAAALRDSKGNIVGAIESIRDITERRRMEETLRQAEEKYRSIFENAVMGIFQTTRDGRIISANPAFARILGYDSPKELIYKITDISRQIYVNPERWAELLHLVEERGAVKDYEIQYRRKDRSIGWSTFNIHAVCDKDGTFLYYEGTIQDITERKLLESRLLQSQKMEAIGTLAGGIAHDFNNILAAIIGYSEMTKGKLQQMELHRYLEHILLASHRAKDLVAQILTFSRHADKELKPVNIKALTGEALKLLRATLPSTIEIRPEIDKRVGDILADPTQLHQVLINLCTNASHAMRERGGVLDVSLDNVEITPDSSLIHPDLNPGLYVKLIVRDTGTGISPAIIDRIFDPFFTTKEKGEGTGLGLSVVYGIAQKYGGTVIVHSNPGEGSTFHVYLPGIEHSAELKAEPVDFIPGGSERILIVDDEELLVGMSREMLEGIGYRITATTSSVNALEMFLSRPERFDLVISDMTMPGMTGKELAKEFLKIRPDIPIILCTGFSDLMTEEDAKSLGIREFLMKPISIRELTRVVRKALDEKMVSASCS